MSGSFQNTPSSRKASPLGPLTDRGDSPTASPLYQKTREVARRGSFASGGAGSPLGVGIGGGAFGRRSGEGTPSPSGIAGKGQGGMVLNSKWLYERGRRGSGVYS